MRICLANDPIYKDIKNTTLTSGFFTTSTGNRRSTAGSYPSRRPDADLADRRFFDRHIRCAPTEVPAEHEDRVGQHRCLALLTDLLVDEGHLGRDGAVERQRDQPSDLGLEDDPQIALFHVDAPVDPTGTGGQEQDGGDQVLGRVLATNLEGSTFGNVRVLAKRRKADAVALLGATPASSRLIPVAHSDSPYACRGALPAPRLNAWTVKLKYSSIKIKISQFYPCRYSLRKASVLQCKYND